MFDKMIADMLGISPAEMNEMLSGMQTLLRDGVAKLNEIHAQNAEIHAQNVEILAKLDALHIEDTTNNVRPVE